MVNLVKHGFVRTPAEDFSDDGTRFYCYQVPGTKVRVSKATGYDQYYISAGRKDYTLQYQVYSKLPHYVAMDRLNGVSQASLTDADIKQLHDDIIEYDREYEEALKKVVYPTIEELKARCIELRAHYQEQADELTALIKNANPFKLLTLREYDRDRLARYYNLITIDRANGYDPDTYPESIKNTVFSLEFTSSAYSDLTGTWYFDECKEILKKALI